MQVTFEASKEELEEMAKMAYVAQNVFDSSGKFSTGYKYPRIREFLAALRTLNKMLVLVIPQSDLVEVDEQSEDRFTHTIKMETECEEVLRQYAMEVFWENLCDKMTDRDYIDEYGGSKENAGSLHSDVYNILYDRNEKELKEYGVKRLHIIEGDE